jgi:hypothetical protein
MKRACLKIENKLDYRIEPKCKAMRFGGFEPGQSNKTHLEGYTEYI